MLQKKWVISGVVGILVVCLLIVLVVYKFTVHTSSQPLNLVIVSIDTLRPDHMSVYGYQKNTTPNISSFAKNATVFTNVTTVVPMTVPSFTAMMTGIDPLKTRILNNKPAALSDNTNTLASILKKNNYMTAAFTSGALSEPISSLNQGFETFHYDSFKDYYYDKFGRETYIQEDRQTYENLISSASAWLTHNKNNKFFLWVHLMDPHAPYEPPSDLDCKFNPKYCSVIHALTPTQLEQVRTNYQLCQLMPPPQRVINTMETLYDGEVAEADRLAQEIFASLKKNGLDKNTVVMVYGDHGEGFDHNYYFNHREVLYNSSIHIPLIIKDPLLSSPATSNMQLQNTDILPSLLDLLGIKYAKTDFDGISFSSILTHDVFTRFFSAPRTISYSINDTATKFSIFDGRYKYIYSLPAPYSCDMNNQMDELYDLKNDPNETKNIYSSQSAIASTLKQQLFIHLAQYNLPPKVKPIQRQSIIPLNNIPTPSVQPNVSPSNSQKNIQIFKGLGY